jgi:hypothetical protein
MLMLSLALSPGTMLYGQNSTSERILIETTGSKDEIIAAVEDWGGEVTHVYRNLDLIAADVPPSSVGDIRSLPGVEKVNKDVVVPVPQKVGPFNTRGGGRCPWGLWTILLLRV